MALTALAANARLRRVWIKANNGTGVPEVTVEAQIIDGFTTRPFNESYTSSSLDTLVAESLLNAVIADINDEATV